MVQTVTLGIKEVEIRQNCPISLSREVLSASDESRFSQLTRLGCLTWDNWFN